jgi:hypothetical protein
MIIARKPLELNLWNARKFKLMQTAGWLGYILTMYKRQKTKSPRSTNSSWECRHSKGELTDWIDTIGQKIYEIISFPIGLSYHSIKLRHFFLSQNKIKLYPIEVFQQVKKGLVFIFLFEYFVKFNETQNTDFWSLWSFWKLHLGLFLFKLLA